MFRLIRRWCIGWLDQRGLHSIAAVLETRAAQAGDVDAMHAAAKRALLQGDHAAALIAIEAALQQQPGNAALWCTRGIAHRLALSFDKHLPTTNTRTSWIQKTCVRWVILASGVWHAMPLHKLGLAGHCFGAGPGLL